MFLIIKKKRKQGDKDKGKKKVNRGNMGIIFFMSSRSQKQQINCAQRVLARISKSQKRQINRVKEVEVVLPSISRTHSDSEYILNTFCKGKRFHQATKHLNGRKPVLSCFTECSIFLQIAQVKHTYLIVHENFLMELWQSGILKNFHKLTVTEG